MQGVGDGEQAGKGLPRPGQIQHRKPWPRVQGQDVRPSLGPPQPLNGAREPVGGSPGVGRGDGAFPELGPRQQRGAPGCPVSWEEVESARPPPCRGPGALPQLPTDLGPEYSRSHASGSGHGHWGWGRGWRGCCPVSKWG